MTPRPRSGGAAPLAVSLPPGLALGLAVGLALGLASTGCPGGAPSPSTLAERHGLDWAPLSPAPESVDWPQGEAPGPEVPTGAPPAPMAPRSQLAVTSLAPSTGFEVGGQWLATSDGAFEADLELDAGLVEITLVAKGIAETGDWPAVRVLLDGREIGSARLDANAPDRDVTERFTSPRYRWLRLPFRSEAAGGLARLRVEYDCSRFDPVERIGLRGILFDRIEVRQRPGPGSACPPSFDPASRRRVLLIGIDGAAWSVILPMVNAGELPNLAGLMAEGSYGPLASEPMTYSPAVWNTIYTGRGRDAHGIDQMSAKTPTYYSGTSHSTALLRSATLWQMLSAAGRTVLTVGMHTTWPAQPVRGVLVSDRAIGGPVEGGVWPLDQDSAVASALEELGVGGTDDLPDAIPAALREVVAHDRKVSALSRAYLTAGQPDLTAVYLALPDHAGHMLWDDHARFGLDHRFDATETDRRPGALHAAYDLVDGLVGDLLDAVDRESTAVVVVSDHSTDLADPVTRTRFRLGPLVRAVAGERAYVPFEESWIVSHVYLNVRGREPNGVVEPARFAAEAAAVRSALERLETDSGRRVFEAVRVVPPSARAASGEGYQPADIVGIVNARIVEDQAVRLPSGESLPIERLVHFLVNRTGTHDRSGILIVAGEGARPGGLVRSATIRDVVPTVLTLLGLPLGADLSGRPVAEALTGGLEPPCVIPSWDPIALRNEPAPVSGSPLTEEERERLRALGYVQ